MSITLVAIEPDGVVDTPVPLSRHATPVIAVTLNNYKRRGDSAPWLCYLTFATNFNVGTCGFVGPPTGNVVEIAYYTFSEDEGKGYAQEAAQALVRIARDAKPEVVITAHTLPEEGPSCRVLRNSGFTHTGSLEHPEDELVWVWTVVEA